MKRIAFRVVPVAALLVAGVAWLGPRAAGQSSPMPSTKNGEWPMYTADCSGSKYSPLDQISASNFSKLEVAWRFKTDNLGPRPENKLEGTPIMVKGTVYATGGTRRAVVALNAPPAKMKWMYAMDEGERATRWAPRQLSGRGLSYWTDGRGDERILYVTTGYRLVSLNAKTGQPIAAFGTNGVLDLKVGVVIGKDKQLDLEKGEIGLHSTPHVVNDTVIVGSSMFEGLGYRYSTNAKGLVRAFDVKTGKQIWRFNTIPGPGEFGNDTWENGSWEWTGNVGVWTQITGRPGSRPRLPARRNADHRRIRRQPPRQQPVRREHRRGGPQDRRAQVALPAVHHGLWDHDNSSASLLIDATIDGKPAQAAGAAEQAGLALRVRPHHRSADLADPEVAVPQTNMPTEKTAPTQPIPDQPAALLAHVRRRERPHRLHAGAARAGAQEPEEVPLGAVAVRAAARPERSAPRLDQHRQHHRRRELAGFGLRSRDRHLLHPGDQHQRSRSASTTKEEFEKVRADQSRRHQRASRAGKLSPTTACPGTQPAGGTPPPPPLRRIRLCAASPARRTPGAGRRPRRAPDREAALRRDRRHRPQQRAS